MSLLMFLLLLLVLSLSLIIPLAAVFFVNDDATAFADTAVADLESVFTVFVSSIFAILPSFLFVLSRTGMINLCP